MVRRSRSRCGGNEPPNAPAPAPNAPANGNAAAAAWNALNLQQPDPNAPAAAKAAAKNVVFVPPPQDYGVGRAGRRTRRRHRTRKSRRGGYTEKSHKRHRVLKALTRHWRNKQQSHEVLSRANERGMEMLRRQAALRAKYSA